LAGDLVANKRGTLWVSRVVENGSDATAAPEQTDDSFDDPERRKDSEDESRDVNEAARMLMVPDTPQAPSDGQAPSEITLRAGERIRSASTLEEKECEEDEELGPELGRVSSRVDTESLKGSQPDKDNCPSVVERERKVDKKFAGQADTPAMLVDNVVDVAYSGAHKEGEDKGDNIMTMRPHTNVDGIEHRKKWEAPADAIDDEFLAGACKLVENETEEKEVNEGPDEEGPGRWSEVGLFSRAVHVARASNGVDIATEEEEIHNDIYNLEEDAIFPRAG